MKNKTKWISGAIKHPGALRETAGVPVGKNIPLEKLRSLAGKPGITGQRAKLAETLRSFKKG